MGLRQTAPGRVFCGLLPAQLASLAISTAWSHDVALSLGGTTWKRWGALTQAAVIVLAAGTATHARLQGRFTRNLLIAIELAGGITGVYGILQYLGWDPLLATALYAAPVGGVLRPPATLHHALYFANFLVPVILIAAGFAMKGPASCQQWFQGAVLFVSLGALALTGTRSATLGVMAGGLILVVLRGKQLRCGRMIAPVLLGVFAALLALAVSPAGQSFRQRLAQWIEDSKGGPRLMVWRDSCPLIREHWLTGIGPEAFAGEFRKIQSLELSRSYPDHYHEDPHNVFLEVTISQGIPGLAILIGLIAAGTAAGLRSAHAGTPESAILLASLAGLTTAFQFSPLTITNWLYYYVIISLLVAGAGSQREIAAPRTTISWGTRLLTLAAAAMMLAAGGAYVAQDYLIVSMTRRLAGGDIGGARLDYIASAKLPFPADDLWCSQRAALLAKSGPPFIRKPALMLAMDASARAERTGDQKFNALYQSAVLALIIGDTGAAERKLRAAASAAPGWYRPREMLARVLRMEGKGPEGDREADAALRCAGPHEAEVKRALLEVDASR